MFSPGDRERGGEPLCDRLVFAEFGGFLAGGDHPGSLLGQPGGAGQRHVGVNLVIGPPDRDDGQDDHLADPVTRRRVGAFGDAEVQHRHRDGRVEQGGVERADEPAVGGGALESGLVGPGHDARHHAVEQCALLAGQGGRISRREPPA
jgi:hypothetical protein